MTRSYGYDTATGALSLLRAGWGASPSVWFQNDSVTRDAIGNVLTATDQVTSTTECFSYDNWNRLKRARTIAAGGVCASAATAGTDSYDVSWTFDDIDRMTTRVDNTTATTSSYTYGDGAHPHAVTAVSSGGSYSYNSAGSMVSRAGTTLGYDALQRLVSYGSAESYVQSTSNQRLVKTSASGRVLYLGEIEVATNGAVRTITRYVSIAGATVAVKTSTGGTDTVMWNCASLQNSITCQAPTSGATPALKRYLPYGGPRNTVTTPNTERGFLGQTQDSSGLTYLNNRYYDPTLGTFLSVDPLVAKTGTPYLYANGNPTTLSDPNGLEPGCGPTAYSATSCHEAYTAASNACIKASGCDGESLVNSFAPSEISAAAKGAGLPTDLIEWALDSPYFGKLFRLLGSLGDVFRYFLIFHNAVVADIVAQQNGGWTLIPGCTVAGHFPDLCSFDPKSIGMSPGDTLLVGEVKPNTAWSVAAGLAQLNYLLRQPGVAAIGSAIDPVSDMRPQSGIVPISILGVTLSWQFRGGGLFTYSISGDLTQLPTDPVDVPTLADVYRYLLQTLGFAALVGVAGVVASQPGTGAPVPAGEYH